ncbi:MAG: hypothetical protein ABIA93_00845 [Candidatus Woesearchaeota archaeon]
MNRALRALLLTMLNRRCIGGKHMPEQTLVKSKTKWLRKAEAREFDSEYRRALNSQLLLRFKKRTGKGFDWHISLNPRKLGELNELLR